MKKLTVLTLLLTILQINFMIQAAQESKMQYELETIVSFDQHVDKMVTALPDMVQIFTFLQDQGLVSQSFHQFLQTRLVRDDVENNDKQDANFGEVLEQAQDLITENMRNRFISILENMMEENQTLCSLEEAMLLMSNIDEIFQQINNIINENIENELISTLDLTTKEKKTIDQLDDPIFLFIMQHKDDFMHDAVRHWLHEWSNIKDIDGYVPLHKAACDNSSIITEMLLAVGADLNIQNNRKETPLHKASEYNSIEVAHVLINANANINIQNNHGWTPLYKAICYENFEIACMLIKAGANVNIPDNDGFTAEQKTHTIEMQAVFKQARKKQEMRSMAIFENQLKKDWR